MIYRDRGREGEVEIEGEAEIEIEGDRGGDKEIVVERGREVQNREK